MSAITEFKWLDPECGHDGCQSLVWKQRLERTEELADKYKWQVRDTCTRAERAERERDALRAALNGLVGLIQLVRSRDDCPVGIKQALTNQYRLDDAFAALEAKP